MSESIGSSHSSPSQAVSSNSSTPSIELLEDALNEHLHKPLNENVMDSLDLLLSNEDEVVLIYTQEYKHPIKSTNRDKKTAAKEEKAAAWEMIHGIENFKRGKVPYKMYKELEKSVNEQKHTIIIDSMLRKKITTFAFAPEGIVPSMNNEILKEGGFIKLKCNNQQASKIINAFLLGGFEPLLERFAGLMPVAIWCHYLNYKEDGNCEKEDSMFEVQLYMPSFPAVNEDCASDIQECISQLNESSKKAEKQNDNKTVSTIKFLKDRLLFSRTPIASARDAAHVIGTVCNISELVDLANQTGMLLAFPMNGMSYDEINYKLYDLKEKAAVTGNLNSKERHKKDPLLSYKVLEKKMKPFSHIDILGETVQDSSSSSKPGAWRILSQPDQADKNDETMKDAPRNLVMKPRVLSWKKAFTNAINKVANPTRSKVLSLQRDLFAIINTNKAGVKTAETVKTFMKDLIKEKEVLNKGKKETISTGLLSLANMMVSYDNDMRIDTCLEYLEKYMKDMTSEPKNYQCIPEIKDRINQVLPHVQYGVAATLITDFIKLQEEVIERGNGDVWAKGNGLYEFFKKDLLGAFFLAGGNPRTGSDWSYIFDLIENLDDDNFSEFFREFRRQFTGTIIGYIKKPMNSYIDYYHSKVITGKKALFVRTTSVDEQTSYTVFRGMCSMIVQIISSEPSIDLPEEFNKNVAILKSLNIAKDSCFWIDVDKLHDIVVNRRYEAEAFINSVLELQEASSASNNNNIIEALSYSTAKVMGILSKDPNEKSIIKIVSDVVDYEQERIEFFNQENEYKSFQDICTFMIRFNRALGVNGRDKTTKDSLPHELCNEIYQMLLKLTDMYESAIFRLVRKFPDSELLAKSETNTGILEIGSMIRAELQNWEDFHKKIEKTVITPAQAAAIQKHSGSSGKNKPTVKPASSKGTMKTWMDIRNTNSLIENAPVTAPVCKPTGGFGARKKEINQVVDVAASAVIHKTVEPEMHVVKSGRSRSPQAKSRAYSPVIRAFTPPKLPSKPKKSMINIPAAKDIVQTVAKSEPVQVCRPTGGFGTRK